MQPRERPPPPLEAAKRNPASAGSCYGDTGEAEAAVRSDLTVTIGFVKRGLVTENAGQYMKRLVAADIGIALARQEDKFCSAEVADPASGLLACPPWLQREPIDVRSASEQELTQN